MLSDAQLLKRRGYICGSDTAAIMRLSPFASPRSIWIQKRYTTEQITDNEAMNRGNRHELPITLNAAERLCVEVVTEPDKLEFIKTGATGVPWMVHLDGLIPELIDGKRCQIESKSTSEWKEWGDLEFSDLPLDASLLLQEQQVPPQYYIQVQDQMWVADLDRTYLAVQVPWYGRITDRLYRVDRNDDLIQTIEGYCSRWWEWYVVGNRDMPDDECRDSDLEVVGRIARDSNNLTPVEMPQELYDLRNKLRDARLRVEKKEKKAQADLLLTLGDAECGILPCGDQIEYRKGKERVTVNKEALREHYPDIYEKFTTTKPGNRRMNIQKADTSIHE